MQRSAFEWTGEQLQKAWLEVGEEILRWWTELSTLPPAGRSLEPARLPQEPKSLSEQGTEVSTVLCHLRERLSGDAQVVGHPGYLAYVAGAANPIAPMAQALAMMLNPYTGTYMTARACVELEEEALVWIKDMVGWPKDALGWLTSGSSLAILSAVIAARESRPAAHGMRRIYVSDQAHHCVGKAAFAAGFGQEEVHILTSREGRIDPASLDAAIANDIAAGRTPVLVVATAGTTNTGRVDPLRAIAEICQKAQAWYHIDAAYGGFFRILPELNCLDGIEAADSLSLDPHKALCMPYGTGVLLCKKPGAMLWPRGLNASYMPAFAPEELRFEYSDISPELSRDFRGLRLWMSLKVFGKEAYRQHLQERYQLAQQLAQRWQAEPQLELVTTPDLSLFTWAVRGDSSGEKTAELLRRIHQMGRFFLTTCRFQERLVIRTCILGFRFHQQQLNELCEDVATALKGLG